MSTEHLQLPPSHARRGRVAARAWACAAVGLAACYSAKPPLGAPCDHDLECPTGQTCNPRTDTCGLPTGDRAWRDDTAADFASPGAYLDEVTVEAAGFVGPAAYLVGGVRLSGIAAMAIPELATATWDAVAANPRSGTSLGRGFELDFGAAAPPGLGLAADDVTVLIEAELELDAVGRWGFSLSADDLAFVEIAPPGSSQFARLIDARSGNNTEVYDAPVAGWYRIRAAIADAREAMSFQLRYDPPGPGGARRIPADRIRARAGDLAGVLVDGFEHAFLLGPRGSTLHAGSLEDEALGADPYGLQVGSGSFGLRWAGQLLIEVAGEYVFRIDSEDGHRAWFDGELVADKLASAPRTTDTPPKLLAPGWYDLVIDVHKQGGPSAHLALTVQEGPTWRDGRVPAANLRPIVGRTSRWTAAASTFESTIPDAGTSTRGLTLELPPGLTPRHIHALVAVNHPALDTIGLVIDPPAGPNVIVAEPGQLSGSGASSRHVTIPASSGGASWSVLASDVAADALTGRLTQAALTLVGPGGVAPFPTTYRYVSGIRDLGEEPIEGFTEVRFALRQVTPETTAGVALRTCDEPRLCDAEPWTPLADGAVPTVPARRFAQYRVELTGDGDVPTALDWIELGYQVELPR